MDKVTQNTAATAEESAAASEELNAQAGEDEGCGSLAMLPAYSRWCGGGDTLSTPTATVKKSVVHGIFEKLYFQSRLTSPVKTVTAADADNFFSDVAH